MNSSGSNDDEMPSLSLAEWDALVAQTSRKIRSRLDAWRADDQRIERIFAEFKRRPAGINTQQCKPFSYHGLNKSRHAC
jgi:hypothetical protein